MEKQEVDREFFWKNGFGYTAGTTVRTPSGDTIALKYDLPQVIRNHCNVLACRREA